MGDQLQQPTSQPGLSQDPAQDSQDSALDASTMPQSEVPVDELQAQSAPIPPEGDQTDLEETTAEPQTGENGAQPVEEESVEGDSAPTAVATDSLIDALITGAYDGGPFSFGTTGLGYEALNNIYIDLAAGGDGVNTSVRFVEAPNFRVTQDGDQVSTRNFYGVRFNSDFDLSANVGRMNRLVTFDEGTGTPDSVTTNIYGANAGFSGVGLNYSNSRVTLNPVGTPESIRDLSLGVSLPFFPSVYAGFTDLATNPDGTPVTAPGLNPIFGGDRQIGTGGFLSFNGFGPGFGLQLSDVNRDGSFTSGVLEFNNPRSPLGAFVPNLTIALQTAGAPADAMTDVAARQIVVTEGGRATIGLTTIGPLPLPLINIDQAPGILEGPPVERVIENYLAAQLSIAGNSVSESFDPLYYQRFQNAFDLNSIVLPAASQNALALAPRHRGDLDAVQFATQTEEDVIQLFEDLNPGLQLNDDQRELLPELLSRLNADISIRTTYDQSGQPIRQEAMAPFYLDNSQEYVLRNFIARQYSLVAQSNPALLQQIDQTFGENANWPDASVIALPERARQHFPALEAVTEDEMVRRFQELNPEVTITEENRPLLLAAMSLRAGNVRISPNGSPVVDRDTDLDAWALENSGDLATHRQPNYRGYEAPRQEVNLDIIRDSEGRRVGLAGFAVSFEPYETVRTRIDPIDRRRERVRSSSIEDTVVVQHNERLDLDTLAVQLTLQQELGAAATQQRINAIISSMPEDEFNTRAASISDEQLQGIIRASLDRRADQFTQVVFDNFLRGGVPDVDPNSAFPEAESNITARSIRALINNEEFQRDFPGLNLSLEIGRDDTFDLWERQVDLAREEYETYGQLSREESATVFAALPLEQRGTAGRYLIESSQLTNEGYVLQNLSSDDGREDLRDDFRRAAERAEQLGLTDIAAQFQAQAQRLDQMDKDNLPRVSVAEMQASVSIPEGKRTPEQQLAFELFATGQELIQFTGAVRSSYLQSLQQQAQDRQVLEQQRLQSQPLTTTRIEPLGGIRPPATPGVSPAENPATTDRGTRILNTALGLANLQQPQNLGEVERVLAQNQITDQQDLVLVFDEIGGLAQQVTDRNVLARLALVQQTLFSSPVFQEALQSTGARVDQLRRVNLSAAEESPQTPQPPTNPTTPPQPREGETQVEQQPALEIRQQQVIDTVRSLVGSATPGDVAAIEQQLQASGLSAAEIVSAYDVLGRVSRGAQSQEELNRFAAAQQGLASSQMFRDAISSTGVNVSNLVTVATELSAQPTETPQVRESAVREVARAIEGSTDAAAVSAQIRQAQLTAAEIFYVHQFIGAIAQQVNNPAALRTLATGQATLRETPEFQQAVSTLNVNRASLAVIELDSSTAPQNSGSNDDDDAPPAPAASLPPEQSQAEIRRLAGQLTALVPQGEGTVEFSSGDVETADALVRGLSTERLATLYNSLGAAVQSSSGNPSAARAFSYAQQLLGQTPTFQNSGLQVVQEQPSQAPVQQQPSQSSGYVDLARNAASATSVEQLNAYIAQQRPSPADLANAYNFLYQLAQEPANSGNVAILQEAQQLLSQTNAFQRANIPQGQLRTIEGN